MKKKIQVCGARGLLCKINQQQEEIVQLLLGKADVRAKRVARDRDGTFYNDTGQPPRKQATCKQCHQLRASYSNTGAYGTMSHTNHHNGDSYKTP